MQCEHLYCASPEGHSLKLVSQQLNFPHRNPKKMSNFAKYDPMSNPNVISIIIFWNIDLLSSRIVPGMIALTSVMFNGLFQFNCWMRLRMSFLPDTMHTLYKLHIQWMHSYQKLHHSTQAEEHKSGSRISILNKHKIDFSFACLSLFVLYPESKDASDLFCLRHWKRRT